MYMQIQQELWCVDIDLSYSNHLALYNLMAYVTGCKLDIHSGALLSKYDEVDRSRYAVLAPHLYHTNLSLLYHHTFFQMCKAHLIGYDPKVYYTLIQQFSRIDRDTGEIGHLVQLS